MLFSFLSAFETDPTIGECVRSDGKMKNAVGADNQDSNYQSDNGTTLFTHSIKKLNAQRAAVGWSDWLGLRK